MEIKAHLRHLHVSPRKVRRVAKLIQGLSVVRADAELLVRPERAAKPLRKLLRSAIANARQIAEANPDEMVVSSFIVNDGRVMKRFRPQSRGIAHPYAHRMSNVSLTLRLPEGVTPRQRVFAPHPASGAPSQKETETSEQYLKTQSEKRSRRPERRRKGASPHLPKFGKRFFQRKSV